MVFQECDFEKAANLRNELSLTDEQLELLIGVTKCLVTYFAVRVEPLVTSILRSELSQYNGFLASRKKGD